MSEPQRSAPRPDGPSSPADTAAQIERLLLSGLDLYFAGQYQEAVNVWTRVVFLERGHGRARAYIDRARAAIAEQQREADELYHRGRAAYNAGDIEQARQLLTRAIERGAADDALALLQQLNRFTTAGTLPSGGAATAVSPPRAHDSRRAWFHLTVATAIVSALALVAAPLYSWFGDSLVAAGSAPPVTTAQAEPLPVARTGERALDNARRLYAGGHLMDALRALDRIDVGDPVRHEAEQLKGQIQRDLLATARQARQATAGSDRR